MVVEVVPSGGPLGATVYGVDFSKHLDVQVEATILDAWHRHLVLVFPSQQLGPKQFLAGSRLFGTPQDAPGVRHGQHHFPEFPQIALMSNVVRKGKPIGNLGNSELAWHSDMTYDPEPPSACILYAIEVPQRGGETWFANLLSSFEALPSELRHAVEGRVAVHDASLNSAGVLRSETLRFTDPTKPPGAQHPIVRTHPVTGRKLIYLGRRQNGYIPGLPLYQSDALLDALWEHITDARYTWAHRWTAGDFVVWDNRATMHRRDALDPSQPRTLYRSQLGGERPY